MPYVGETYLDVLEELGLFDDLVVVFGRLLVRGLDHHGRLEEVLAVLVVRDMPFVLDRNVFLPFCFVDRLFAGLGLVFDDGALLGRVAQNLVLVDDVLLQVAWS